MSEKFLKAEEELKNTLAMYNDQIQTYEDLFSKADESHKHYKKSLESYKQKQLETKQKYEALLKKKADKEYKKQTITCRLHRVDELYNLANVCLLNLERRYGCMYDNERSQLYSLYLSWPADPSERDDYDSDSDSDTD